MVTQVEAIKNFLIHKTHKDLAELYNPFMEVQIIVNQSGGERVEQEYKGKLFRSYTDGLNTWYPIRIPKNAGSNPEYEDKEMTFDLIKYTEGIGMTGWDWKNKRSIWVAFDFDALIGHSEKHNRKLTNNELENIVNAVKNIPWIQVRKSTSGKGLHLYVYIDENIYSGNNVKGIDNNITNNPPLIIHNHNEHSALARAILSQLSALCNYDFTTKVDTYGGNMWVYHRKMEGTDGLSIIKQNESKLKHIPPDWKIYIPVITRKRSITLPIPNNNDINGSIIDQSTIDVFEQCTSQKVKINLDKQHQQLINWLTENGYYCTWNAEKWILITHTYALKQAHQALKLKGRFQTISPATDLNTANVWVTPHKGGWWTVRRYTQGTEEHQTWFLDDFKWTTCYLNRELTLNIAAKIYNGIEDEKGNFVFPHAEDAIKALQDMGINENINLPSHMLGRQIVIKKKLDKLTITIERNENDNLLGWINMKKYWKKVINLNSICNNTPSNNELSNDTNYSEFTDDVVRHILDEERNSIGWVIKSEANQHDWNIEPLQHIKAALQGYYKYDITALTEIVGNCVARPWIIVNRPFQPEYIGNRLWNRKTAQFRFNPTVELPTDINNNGNSTTIPYNKLFPTWYKILDHIGKNLDYFVTNSDWGKENGIQSGRDYLLCWIASMFQNPTMPLPYLFLYGPQDCGKSTLHESLERLMTRGYIRADNTLCNPSGHNGELEGNVLAVVEETDLQKSKVASNRIKDWTNAVNILVHHKYKTPYLVQNTLHWIQCSNDINACPVFTDDTRITMIRVNSLENNKRLAKNELLRMIDKEAPDFIKVVLDLELPLVVGRFGIPVITTQDKIQIQKSNRNPAEEFIEDKCTYSPGEYMKYDELYQQFKAVIDPNESAIWTKIKFGKNLPHKYPKGKIKGEVDYFVGNIKLKINEDSDNEQNQNGSVHLKKYICIEDRLILQDINEEV